MKENRDLREDKNIKRFNSFNNIIIKSPKDIEKEKTEDKNTENKAK